MTKSISLSYLPFNIIDPNTNQLIGEIFRPFISIKLSIEFGKIIFPVEALVDSGADRNLFPLTLGEIIGINFKNNKQITLYGIGGSKIIAYRARLNIWLLGSKYETEADFAPLQKIPILGRSGFFNLFKSIKFREKDRFLDIEF